MRNLNECQAEIFRRSEKRIKARKQRRIHTLMACVPLVLCITLFSAFFLPGSLQKESADPSANESAMGGLTADKSESFPIPIARVTVSGLGFSQTYVDTSDVLLISDHLFSYETRAPEMDGTPNHSAVVDESYREESTDDVSDGIAESETTGYTITLLTHEGQKTEYCLAGKTLKNLTTEEIYTLTQKQANELKDLLGIPR